MAAKIEVFRPKTGTDNHFMGITPRTDDSITIGATAIHVFHVPFVISQIAQKIEVIYNQGLHNVLTITDFETREYKYTSDIMVTLTPEQTSEFELNALDTFVQLKITDKAGGVDYNELNKLKVYKPLK